MKARGMAYFGVQFWMAMTLLVVVGQVLATSDSALRFFGTGVGPPEQQDRLLLPVDDNEPGMNSSVIDVGSGSFTLEFWMRGNLADNMTSHGGGDVVFNGYNWIDGNIILDRDVWCGTERSYGVSLAGGKVRFGLGSGDGSGSFVVTIEGSEDVLDGQWHHIAAIRDQSDGSISLVVDGVLDMTSGVDWNVADLSYPDVGVPVTGNCNTGQLTAYGWYLVVAAEKHDAGASYPSFNGFVDELRIWNTARSVTQISEHRFSVINAASPGLVGHYRFEEGSGTVVQDQSAAGAPSGVLVAGVPGNGQWVSRTDDVNNTAPINDVIFTGDFEP